MAWLFGGTSDYITITDNAALTIPDGDWTVAGWVKLTSNVGSNRHVLFDTFAGGITWFELMIGQASHSIADDIRFDSADDDGTALITTSTSNPFANNTNWTHIIVQRSGTTVTIYINNSSVASATNASYDASNGGNWVMGRWADGSAGGYLNGALAEWAKWDRALNADERAALMNGFSPLYFLNSLKWYAPMIREYRELKEGILVTNVGTVATEHPRIIYPFGAIPGHLEEDFVLVTSSAGSDFVLVG